MPPVSMALCRKLNQSWPAAALVAAAVMLSACQNKSANLTGGDDLTTASVSQPAGTPSFKKTEELGQVWEKDKANAKIGFAYAENLGRLGQMPAAARVLRGVADGNPGNAAIQAEAGKKLLGAGSAADAIVVLDRATQLNPSDWQSLSALGSAYDQKTQHAEARERYKAALAINPGAVGVRNNLAMSYALQGQLPESEKMLRELMNGDGASNSKVRQNLALVVGLQGRFDEARSIASKDLPPDEVDANLAYLQQMLSQPNTWAQLQQD